MSESMIETYERHRRELIDVEMADRRERSKRELDRGMASMMGGILGQMAASSNMAALLVKDTNLAARCAGDGTRYAHLAALAYAGVPAEKIVELMCQPPDPPA